MCLFLLCITTKHSITFRPATEIRLFIVIIIQTKPTRERKKTLPQGLFQNCVEKIPYGVCCYCCVCVCVYICFDIVATVNCLKCVRVYSGQVAKVCFFVCFECWHLVPWRCSRALPLPSDLNLTCWPHCPPCPSENKVKNSTFNFVANRIPTVSYPPKESYKYK